MSHLPGRARADLAAISFEARRRSAAAIVSRASIADHLTWRLPMTPSWGKARRVLRVAPKGRVLDELHTACSVVDAQQRAGSRCQALTDPRSVNGAASFTCCGETIRHDVVAAD